MSDPETVEQKVERARSGLQVHIYNLESAVEDTYVADSDKEGEQAQLMLMVRRKELDAAIDALVLVARQAERVEALEDVRDAFARVPVQFARIIEMLDAARKAAEEGA